MADHDVMRGMACEYRQKAEIADDPARRNLLIELATYCEKMAVAMEQRQSSPATQRGPSTRAQEGRARREVAGG